MITQPPDIEPTEEAIIEELELEMEAHDPYTVMSPTEFQAWLEEQAYLDMTERQMMDDAGGIDMRHVILGDF